MPIQVTSVALKAPGASNAPYLPPATPIDPLMKLRVLYSQNFPTEEGTGFVLTGASMEHIIFAARHVLRPLGKPATKISIEASSGDFLAAVFAVAEGVDDIQDCGVAAAIKATPTTGFRVREAAHESFDATIRGFARASRTAAEVKRRVRRDGDLLRYAALDASHAGFSGGPILVEGHVVGMHIRADMGLCLPYDILQACIDAADSALEGV
jgi:hypothetical protein